MIETLPIDGGPLVALEARGKLTHEDYQKTILPRLDAALREHERVRCLCVLGEEFEGLTPAAAWDDLKFDIKHGRQFERIAVVSDGGIVRAAVRMSTPLFGGEVRVFHLAERPQAEEWVQEGLKS